MVQELPPTEGYPSIRIHRNLPNKNISPLAVGLGLTLFSIYGLFQLSNVWRERRELKREKLWARLYILPLVQAEWDRDWMKWRAGELEKEREIMKDVKDWDVGGSKLYHHSDEKWVPPKFDLEANPVRFPFIKWVDTGEPL